MGAEDLYPVCRDDQEALVRYLRAELVRARDDRRRALEALVMVTDELETAWASLSARPNRYAIDARQLAADMAGVVP